MLPCKRHVPATSRPRASRCPRWRCRLGYLLKHAQLRLAELTAAAMAPFGITGRQCAVLIAIDSQPPLAGAKRSHTGWGSTGPRWSC